MQHYWSLDDVHLKNAWVTIGSFDGVHLGHQKIIHELVTGARHEKAPTVVITFFPHPAVVLGKRKEPKYLTSPIERAKLFEKLGVDVVITHPFNLHFAQTSADDFMKNLKLKLDLKHLLVGVNFALGRNREGDVNRLKEIGDELGYVLHVIPPVKEGDQIVSSSQIRAALEAGEVEKAARLLGRPYQVSGKVIRGDGRGRAIGIPTANLNSWEERIIPKAGVYVCRAQVNGKVWGAVTNVGVRPTFYPHTVPPIVEAHILDFDADIYGEEVPLDFLTRLRDEIQFPNIQELIHQINQDILRARELLSQNDESA